MGKELVISSNRHETKVAVLEDDQLVEVYFQRSNEYSLAGSIHKGRVTRVLPGMQSAFVDLGLDRDTFLYVSDFFEEHEEYDRITTEDRGRERGRERDREREREPERPAAGAAGEIPAVTAAAATPVEAEAAGEAEPGVAQPGEDREAGDRRVRRSRRRRNRGRGFPDSKYVSDVSASETEPEPVPEAEPESEPRPESPDATVGQEDFMVLPGESLAKYTRSPDECGESELAKEVDAALEVPDNDEAAVEVVIEESSAEVEFTDAAAAGGVTVIESAQSVEAAAETSELSEDELDELREDLISADLEPPAEAAPQPETQQEAEPVATVVEDELQAALEQVKTAVSGEQQEPAAADTVESEVEPARTPQSLTATLREQGQTSRYLHRGSRRMRRKMRGGQYEGQSETRSESRPFETQPEPRDTEPRSQSRAEGTERPSRDSRETRDQRGDQKSAHRPERAPLPSITDLLKEGQEIIVQIAKEPLGQKGARITSHIALPGRYVVYMPTLEHMGVSRKIESDEERYRLKRILQAHHSGVPGGYIVRTAGAGKSENEIAADMEFLYNLWLDIRQKAERLPAPALLHHDLEIVQRILRDQLTENFKTIWSDSEEIYESVLRFVQRFQPALVNRVKLYTRPSPIFEAFNITQELEKALRPKVWLRSGGYIVINQTEALVAIDVNTGKFVGKSNRLEDTIVKTNTEAVKEIVRQVRLRDLGGIIVIDFIDMDERKNRQKVMQALEEAMHADRAPYKILQFNDFGLVAITRKRVKQSLERTLCSPCPHCEGAGYVKSVATVISEILQEAVKLAKVVSGPNAVLRVNPEVAKTLKSTENRYLEELEEILGRPVLVTSDALLHQEKFDLA